MDIETVPAATDTAGLGSGSNTEPRDTMDPTTARRVEQEKITRRAALRKLGFGAGLAAFSLLGVDDLARMVGKRLEQMAGDNKVANQVAKEFQQAGIAMASSGPSHHGTCCSTCEPQDKKDGDICLSIAQGCYAKAHNPSQIDWCYNQCQGCIKLAQIKAQTCIETCDWSC